jgi:hypothetical protein
MRRLVALLLFAATVLIVIVATTERDELKSDATVAYQQAVYHWSCDDYPACLRQCEEALACDPDLDVRIAILTLKVDVLKKSGQASQSAAVAADLERTLKQRGR